MMFNTINWLRLALITSFIFGCCCSQNEVYRDEKYRELQENALCEDGEPLVCFRNFKGWDGPPVSYDTTTLNRFVGNQGLIIMYDENAPVQNLCGKYKVLIISGELKFTDLGLMRPEQLGEMYKKFIGHYKTLTLPPKEVRKLLRDSKGVKLANLDAPSINAALTNPAPIELNNINNGEFAIVCVPLYGYLAIINNRYEFVDMNGAKASIDNSAKSLWAFCQIHKSKISFANTDDFVKAISPEHLLSAPLARIVEWNIVEDTGHYKLN